MSMLTDILRPAVRRTAGNARYIGFLGRLGREGRLPDWLWRRWPVYGDFELELPNGGSVRITGAVNDWLERMHFFLGMRGDEPETYPLFMKLAAGSELVLDVGANIGIFTLLALASDPRTRVISFEPSPAVFSRLKANVEANGWSGRCEPRMEAASSSAGTVAFDTAGAHRSIHAGIYPLRVGKVEASPANITEVRANTVDAACEGKGRVGLAKIDVEGYEDEVLRGMRRTLEEHRPHLIIECLPAGPCRNITDILKPLGYRFFHIRRGGLEEKRRWSRTLPRRRRTTSSPATPACPRPFPEGGGGTGERKGAAAHDTGRIEKMPPHGASPAPKAAGVKGA